MLECELSYFYCFIYELLIGFHGNDVLDRYDLIKNTYLAYRNFVAKIDFYLVSWLVDYCVINDIYVTDCCLILNYEDPIFINLN